MCAVDNFFLDIKIIYGIIMTMKFMEELNQEIKNRKLFYGKQRRTVIFAAAAGIVLFTVIFLIAVLISKNKKPAIPIAPSAPKEKTMEEVMKDLTAPAKEGEKAAPVSDEVIKSLTAPIAANSDTATGSKNSKIVQPAPTPISEDVINSLTAPAVK